MSLLLIAAVLLATSTLEVPTHPSLSNPESHPESRLAGLEGLGGDHPELTGLPALKPPRGPLPLSVYERHKPLFWAGAGCLVLASGGLFFYLRRALPEPVIAPALQARRDLENAAREIDPGLLLSDVSRVVRLYIVQTFNLPGGELNTAEFLSAAYASNDVGPRLADSLAVFLKACDDGKFAPEPAGLPGDPTAEALKLIAQGEQRLVEIQPAVEVKSA